MRSAFLVVGLAFCVLFGGMTVAVAAQYCVDIFTLISLLIVGMILIGVVGAIRNPPDDR